MKREKNRVNHRISHLLRIHIYFLHLHLRCLRLNVAFYTSFFGDRKKNRWESSAMKLYGCVEYTKPESVSVAAITENFYHQIEIPYSIFRQKKFEIDHTNKEKFFHRIYAQRKDDDEAFFLHFRYSSSSFLFSIRAQRRTNRNSPFESILWVTQRVSHGKKMI